MTLPPKTSPYFYHNSYLTDQQWNQHHWGAKTGQEALKASRKYCPPPSAALITILWIATGSSPTIAFHYTSGSQPDLFRKAGYKPLYTNLRKTLLKNTMFLFFGGLDFLFCRLHPYPHSNQLNSYEPQAEELPQPFLSHWVRSQHPTFSFPSLPSQSKGRRDIGYSHWKKMTE